MLEISESKSVQVNVCPVYKPCFCMLCTTIEIQVEWADLVK